MIAHIFNCLKLIIFDIDISHRYYFNNILFLFLNINKHKYKIYIYA